jgi:hypothetical protein
MRFYQYSLSLDNIRPTITSIIIADQSRPPQAHARRIFQVAFLFYAFKTRVSAKSATSCDYAKKALDQYNLES